MRKQFAFQVNSKKDASLSLSKYPMAQVSLEIPGNQLTSIDDDDDGDAKVGNLVSGIVEKVTPTAVIVHVNSKSYLKGTISIEHLADHQGHGASLKSLLKPGFEFDQLLLFAVLLCNAVPMQFQSLKTLDESFVLVVIDMPGWSQRPTLLTGIAYLANVVGTNLILSAKYSLINSAKLIPLDIAQIHRHTIIPSRCGLEASVSTHQISSFSKATEDPNVDLSQAFYIGQSVRSHILNISKLQLADSGSSETKWMEKFTIGSLVEGEIQEIKEFGVVVNFKEHSDVVGFISDYQLGGVNVQKGLVVRALVLDVSKTDGLVDLSLKPDLVSNAREVDLNQQPTHKVK
ncbi:hypothetical protein ACLOJK_021080 [Asimina triloba]